MLHRLGPAVALCLLFCTSTLAADVIPDSPPSFDDEAPETQYVILVDRDGDAPAWDVPPGSKRMLLSDKDGRRFSCMVPPPDGSESERELNSSQTVAKHKSLDDEQQPSHYLDALAGLCFYRIEDWWTYEYCYKKHVRQFHKEKEEVVAEYSLGTYDAERSDPDTVQVLEGSGVSEVKYVSNVYTSGEPCDITGQHRETEVRYMCLEDGQDQITSIKEPATCHYLLTMHTPRLCKHPQFHLPEPPLAHIVCTPFNKDPQQLSSSQTDGGVSPDPTGAVEAAAAAAQSTEHAASSQLGSDQGDAGRGQVAGTGSQAGVRSQQRQQPAPLHRRNRAANIDYEALLAEQPVQPPQQHSDAHFVLPDVAVQEEAAAEVPGALRAGSEPHEEPAVLQEAAAIGANAANAPPSEPQQGQAHAEVHEHARADMPSMEAARDVNERDHAAAPAPVVEDTDDLAEEQQGGAVDDDDGYEYHDAVDSDQTESYGHEEL